MRFREGKGRHVEVTGSGHDPTPQVEIWALALVLSFIGHVAFGSILHFHSFIKYASKIGIHCPLSGWVLP